MNNVDRVSSLPDPIIHQILQTAILSKRWRNIWKSTPFLNFHLDTFLLKNSFLALVNCTLFLRHATSIIRFSLRCCQSLDAFCMYNWVIAALGRNVGELYIDSYLKQFELPHRLFTSNVRKIRLHSRSSPFNFLLPISMCNAAKIESLELSCVKLPDKTSEGELLISCPRLKYLDLRYCDYGELKWLTISSPLLETLRLTNRVSTVKMKISSPNLKSLYFLGILFEDYVFENLVALDIVYFRPDLSNGMAAGIVRQCMSKFFYGIQNVCCLEFVMSCTFHNNFKSSAVLTDQWEGFPSLKRLELYGISPCMAAKFLQKLPSIESLVYRRSHACMKEHEDLLSYPSNPFELCFLTTVKIRNARQDEEELKFLKATLQNAPILDEVVIISSQITKAEFTKKLAKLHRASSSARITLCKQY